METLFKENREPAGRNDDDVNIIANSSHAICQFILSYHKNLCARFAKSCVCMSMLNSSAAADLRAEFDKFSLL